MPKNKNKHIDLRADFCKLALKNPQKASERLKGLAEGLAGCRNTSDTIEALTTIFCVGERTIFRDLMR